jgi:hypothetical protein
MTRTDIHSPKNFDPATYTYIGSFDNFPAPGTFVSNTRDDYDTQFGRVEGALNFAHAEYIGARRLMSEQGAKIHFDSDEGNSQCDHCGARIRYVSIFKHTSDELIAVGDTCAAERFGCDSRREYDIKRLREVAASQRESAKAFGKASEFLNEVAPELVEWMLTPEAEKVGGIFLDISRKLIRFGSISEKQVAFCGKLLQDYFQRQRNGGRTDRELQYDAEREAAEDCPNGRVAITGVVLKESYQESDFGETLKLTIKDDRGFMVYVTCPSSISNNVGKGSRLTMMVTLQQSDRDAKFGFGKRPSKAVLLNEAIAA